MIATKSLTRAAVRVSGAPRASRNISQARAPVHPYRQRRQQHFVRSVTAVTALAGAATAVQWYYSSPEVHAEEPPQEPEVNIEQPRRPAVSTEDNRELISSQHVQVKQSWENPGVWLWGSNKDGVAAPDSKERYIKSPRRLRFFDGVLLRDIKLNKDFAAAIDEKGDLLQWGKAFSPTCKEPTPTLKGKNLVSCALSRDRIIALSKSGAVYSIPASQEEQKTGPKPTSSSWIPFFSSSDDISYRIRTPSGLHLNEKVTTIASGLEHALLLTSAGRVFSFASGTQDFPRRGQLGVPGLTWENRPEGAFDLPHEIPALKGIHISKIAAGDYHSLVSDAAGRCFTFGDNSAGQLGFDFNAEQLSIDEPCPLFTGKLYPGGSRRVSVTDVFAGGNTSFLTIEADKPGASLLDPSSIRADTWAFGFGLTGQLGNGRWVHNQNTPVKIPALSGLTEYDEKTSRVVPIKVAYISAGATHAAAVLDNVASVDVSGNSKRHSQNDINWGQDVLFWGNNEFYQIGSGKRNNVSAPTYIQALDQKAELARASSVLASGIQNAEHQWHRLQITPKQKVKVGGRTVNMEQRVECGRGVTAVYSAV